MTQTQLKEKVLNLEAELKFIKKSLQKEVDFAVDEENWNNVKNGAKKIRKNLEILKPREFIALSK